VKDQIKGLQPERLWHYFYELSQVPRESRHEAGAIDWAIGVAKQLNLHFKKDKVGNLCISKPAAPGYENHTPVVLQGHIDMVCEKNSGTVHDFRQDPIRLVRDGEWVRAEGTTLGSDNGIGVAAALAVLEDKTLAHPPLEALFTIDEETGLTGANALEPGFIKGKILLNCDTEEDDTFFVGCAGGKNTEIRLDINWEKAPANLKAVSVKLSGLLGGHSGLDIDKNRANAIKQLNRILWKAAEKINFRLFHLEGGSKHNAIPRETEYRLLIGAEQLKTLRGVIAAAETMLKNEYKGIERDVRLTVSELDTYPSKVFSPEFQARLLNFIYALPHGVKKMSQAVPGLVETSTNAAIVQTSEKQISFLTSQRSSVATEIIGIADKVKAIGLLAGGKVNQGTGYPAWTPNLDSAILKQMKSIYQTLFGSEPQVKAVHAGLECGIIGEKYAGMDMISIGPTIHGAHSPDERVHIQSVAKFWRLLTETLRQIA